VIRKWAWCGCLKPLSFRKSILQLTKETGEFLVNPCVEEFSDIVFAVGRLLGGLFVEKYISLPGDNIAISKLRERMMIYQCVRDYKSLVNGRCPYEKH
jgi:hypothetical protein